MNDFQFNFKGQGPITPPTFVTPRQRAEEQQASQQALQQKEARKAEIRKRLAEIDAQLARHNQYSVAAEAARIGDMTPYMQILSQQQNAGAAGRAAAQGIENELYNAAKYLPALDGTDEERRAATGAIQVALDKADAKGGEEIKKLKIYRDLKNALGSPRGSTVAAKINELENRMWDEREKLGHVSDATYKELTDLLASEEGSDKTGRGQQVADRYKPYTQAAKAKVAADKAEAAAAYKAWPHSLNSLQARVKWKEYTDANHPITKYYELPVNAVEPRKKVK